MSSSHKSQQLAERLLSYLQTSSTKAFRASELNKALGIKKSFNELLRLESDGLIQFKLNPLNLSNGDKLVKIRVVQNIGV